MNQEQLRHIIKFDRKLVDLLEKEILSRLNQLRPTDASNDTSDQNQVNIIRAAIPEDNISQILFERRQHLREILQYEKMLQEQSQPPKE